MLSSYQACYHWNPEPVARCPRMGIQQTYNQHKRHLHRSQFPRRSELYAEPSRVSVQAAEHLPLLLRRARRSH